MDNYTLENLSKIFKTHAKKYDKEWLEHNRKHGFEHFNLSKALHEICERILDLQKGE